MSVRMIQLQSLELTVAQQWDQSVFIVVQQSGLGDNRAKACKGYFWATVVWDHISTRVT
jgi:hypothetical protein